MSSYQATWCWVACEAEGTAMAGRCWPVALEFCGAGGRSRSIWEREEAILQAMGGCTHSSKAEG